MIINPGLRWRIGGGQRRRLIAPGVLATPLTLTRAQVSTSSTTLGADDATWSEVAADVPRYYGSARRLRIEGQRTNLTVDARTPGGTGWTRTAVASPVAVTGPDGVSGSALLLTEDTSAGGHFITPANISYTSGQSYTFSLIARPGTCDLIQLLVPSAVFGANVWVTFDLTAGTALFAGSAVTRTKVTLFSGGWVWVEFTAPATATASGAGAVVFFATAGTANVRVPGFTGTSRNFSAWVAWAEQASFASTPILPATTGSATRGADLLTGSFPLLYPGGRGTIILAFNAPQNAPSGIDQNLIQLDGGADTDRIRIRNAAGGATIVAGKVVSSAVTDLTSLGNMTAGATTAVGLTWDGAGGYIACLRGGSPQTGTSAPTAFTTVRLMNNAGNTVAGFAEIAYGDFPQRSYTATELQALVNAIPLT